MSARQGTGFFTLGVSTNRYHLPHPLLGFPVILLIRRVLLSAFQILREKGFDLASATEDQVTDALRATIENDLRQTGKVPGFSKRTFEFVVRQGQWKNYNGTVLTKTPDLFFKLRDDEGSRTLVLSEFDGLFIEAKPVDSSHPARSKYCDDGLIRFLRGDYAWAMQEGMMLAYTRDGRCIGKHLNAVMSDTAMMTRLRTISPPAPSSCHGAAACPGAEAVHISQHRRSFTWPDGKGPASNITVYHLWYDCG
jgi:hypothetical protein